jgi:50S ribosomal subunit-associated GTPase HflX
MTDTDKNASSQQRRIDELQSLLADVLPELVAYYHQEKVKTDRSAIHRGKAGELRDLLNRVARQVGKDPIGD